MLFYTTTGKFGEADFAIECHEVFPLDIGSAGYTEYETDDPEFIKWMMEDMSRLEMPKGHCHSHNTMETFFSGTDMSELAENAPNHNVYVSLIVNNRNVNCAKVAFVVTENTVIPGVPAQPAIPAHKVETGVIFNDMEGNAVSKKFFTDVAEVPAVEEVKETIKSVKYVYTQDCDIEYPASVGGGLTARFRKLSDNLRKKEAEKEAARTKNHGRNSTGVRGGQQDYYGGGGHRAWNQPELFDTRKGSGEKTEKEERSNHFGNIGVQTSPNGKRTLMIPERISGKELLNQMERDSKKKDKEFRPLSTAYVSLPKNTKQDLYSMISKILSLDVTSEDDLPSLMRSKNMAYYPQGTRTTEMRTEANFYYDQVGRACRKFYAICFPDDDTMIKYEDTMGVVIEILSTFDTHFPELTENLTEVIKDTFFNRVGGNY